MPCSGQCLALVNAGTCRSCSYRPRFGQYALRAISIGKELKPCYHVNQNNNRRAKSIMVKIGSLSHIVCALDVILPA